MEWLSWLDSLTAIIVSIITIGGFLYGGWKMLISPIRSIKTVLTENTGKLNRAIDTIDNDLLPFVRSMTEKFSKNSGKSIKDQIDRIDENTKLSELRIKLIATNLVTTGIFECAPDGTCIWVNRALADMFGMERQEMLENGWLLAVNDEERAEVWDEWVYSIQNHIPYEAEYTVHNKKTKENFKVRVMAIANKADSGKILGYFGTVIKLS